MKLFTSARHEPALLTMGAYRLRLADGPDDIRAAQALRFQVFNIELQEGLASSMADQLDIDEFDAVCSHLLVEKAATGEVVGTYRMQTGHQAARHHGYYCEREFDFTTFDPLRSEVLELGRACIHADHRSFSVLSLLWRGIVKHAHDHHCRYLLGCSSLTSQDPAEGASAYLALQKSLAPPHLRTVPQPAFSCALDHGRARHAHIPKLLSAYMALGAWICAPPAIDRDFKTIDFLTLMDLKSPEMALRRKRFGIF